MPQWILSPQGRPFRDRDAAALKRDLVAAELGADVHLNVIPHPDGGFAVTAESRGGHESELDRGATERPCDPRESEASPREELERLATSDRDTVPRRRLAQPGAPIHSGEPSTAPPADTQDGATLDVSERYPARFRLSPSPRAFLALHVQALVGTVLLFQPHLLFRLLGIKAIANPNAMVLLFGIVAIAGAILLCLALSRFLWAYTANTYLIDPAGVEQIEWYWEKGRLRRRAPRVNFSHLRAADVEQTMLQMLLDVGSVRLASGGTDDYEVVLRNVAAPRALSEEIQRRSLATAPSSLFTSRLGSPAR